jgi:hypothetical protein
MKTTLPLASRIARIERSLEATLFAAATVVVTGGTVAVFVRLAFGLD